MRKLLIHPDYSAPTTPFRHTWEGVANVDQFRWFVRRDMQEQLQLAHDELHVRHVRAVGMFDDELRVLALDPKEFHSTIRRPRVNFQLLDYCFDSLLDRGLNPMFTTCFMPSVLAAGIRTCFSTGARISPPQNPAAWADLVSTAVRHVITRYGRTLVRQWHFEVWNEPNLMNGFFEGTQAEFFSLWATTCHAIKSVDPELRIGGPSSARAEWIADLIDFGRKNDCVPDYIIAHVYNNDSESSPLSPFDGPQEDMASKSPHFASGVVRGVHSVLRQLDFKGEVHWNEWGRSWWPCETNRENANEAAFIAKTMAEVSQLGDFFAYWCLSDIYDQVGYGKETFHGNYGLLNLQGLRKPAYHAFQLLSRLGTQTLHIVPSATLTPLTNALATQSSDKISILIYDYDPIPQIMPAKAALDVEVTLPPGTQPSQLTVYRIDSDENNIIAAWKHMGSPDYLSREQVALLRARNHLVPSLTTVRINEGRACLTMERSSLCLLEIQTL